MKLTIIRKDGAVYKDGLAYSGLDLSSIPSNVHALQFNTVFNAGWIEFVQENEFVAKPANETITALPEWATAAMAKWDAAKAAETTAEQIE
jgi:hypothetical protein